MQLSPSRFVKIDGTQVAASVNSLAEAKLAIKEIKHKKREYLHIKRGLVRERKAAEKVVNAATSKKKPAKGLLSKVGSAISAVASMAGAYGPASARMELQRIEQDCASTEEILHNLDAVLIQIEGKLLRLS